MGYEANLCSPYYISRPSLKNVSRVFNETEAVTQQRERKEERGDLFAEMFAQREENAARGRGQTQPHSRAIECPDPVLGCTGPPVLTFEEHRRAHGLFSPRLGGSCAFPSNHLERRANLPAVGGLAFTAHKRAGCSPEPRWESGIINRSY